MSTEVIWQAADLSFSVCQIFSVYLNTVVDVEIDIVQATGVVTFSGGEWHVGRSLAVEGQEESGSLCCNHSLLLSSYVHLCNLLNIPEISFGCLHFVFHNHSFYSTGSFKQYLWRKPLKVQNNIWELMFIFRAVGCKVEMSWHPRRTLYVYMACIKFFWLVAAASLMSPNCRDSWLQEFSQKSANVQPYILYECFILSFPLLVYVTSFAFL